MKIIREKDRLVNLELIKDIEVRTLMDSNIYAVFLDDTYLDSTEGNEDFAKNAYEEIFLFLTDPTLVSMSLLGLSE